MTLPAWPPNSVPLDVWAMLYLELGCVADVARAMGCCWDTARRYLDRGEGAVELRVWRPERHVFPDFPDPPMRARVPCLIPTVPTPEKG